MHCSFSKTVLAAFSIISIASAGPIAARQVCGAAPTGTVAQTPLAQPTGITTAADCAAQCKGNPACLSFLFGLVDGIDKCILYSVPAASVPIQTNLVAYDIACTSIPSVVPTTANPGGLARRQAPGVQGSTPAQGASVATPGSGTQTVGTHANPINAVPAGSPSPIAEPIVDDLSACLAACKGNPACIAYTFESGVCKLFGSTVARRQQQGAAPGSTSGQGAQNPSTGSSTTTTPTITTIGTHANPINAVPAGSPSPIAEPIVDDLSACLAACKGNPACIAYTFESGVCKLFGSTVARRQQQGAALGSTSGQGAQNPSTGSTSGQGAQNPSTGSSTITTPTTTTKGTHANPINAVPAGSPAPIATPAVDDLTACLDACKGNPACIAYVFESGVCKLYD